MSAPYASGQPRQVPGAWPENSPTQSAPPSQQESARQLQSDWVNKNSNTPSALRPGIPPAQSQDPSRYLSQPQSQQQTAPVTTDTSQALATRRPSGSRVCAKCGNSLSGQFVRALDATYHLECFTCHECGKIVASKFFPVPDDGPNQYPLCEKDYFRRLDLLCYACGSALRGSYITALDRKYHIEHFTCSTCPTVFGAQDSYYEHDGSVYCHYHYSTRFAQRCHGCHNAILKQFVEIFRNGQNQHWHPECYMIHKYWNVRLHNPDIPDSAANERPESEENASPETRKTVRQEEERVEVKVLWIWRSLSTFEERAATCISDMLLHVSNGSYFNGIMAARKFIVHIELFFESADELDQRLTKETQKGLSYSREAKLLCKKVVSFFQLLSESQSAGMQRLGVTQELLSLVTGLAHYLKLLIRICLQGALKLERDSGNASGLNAFLEKINTLDERLALDETRDPIADSIPYVNRTSDACPVCDKPVEDKCARKGERVYHYPCMVCKRCGVDLKDNLQEAMWSPSLRVVLCRRDASQVPDAEGGFIPITRLQQYVHLLKVAHARLLATLRSLGAIPRQIEAQDTGLYDASNRMDASGSDPTNRANQLALQDKTSRRESTSLEQTLGDIRRLRSTRMDKELGTAVRRARSSRIIEGPGGVSARPGSSEGLDDPNNRQNLQIVHDRDPNRDPQVMFGAGQMALDDIPRILQAEVTKEFRPNAAKYAGNNLVSSEPKARLINGHRRDMSGATELDKFSQTEVRGGPRKFFSELSALEYVIVRPIAVLYMESLLDGHFTQQELIDLIEVKRPTFWDRFFKADKAAKAAKKKPGIFAKNLEAVVNADGAESTDGVGPGALRVPALLEQAVTAMRNMDMSVEGVFRKNGNIRRLRELQEEIDMKGCEAVDLTRENPVQVAALLKKFLRELPDPVLTFKLHKLFITAARIRDEDTRRRVIHLACCLLPKAHRDTMEILLTFLKWASSFHTVDEESGSKMDIHNLATVIAPNILYSSSKSPDLETSFLAVEAIHTLIECNESMCEVPEDIVAILNDPSLSADGNPENLTTKEILKRYGDIRSSAIPQPSPSTASPSSARPQRHNGRPGALTQGDPQAWQNESSVRHVGAPYAGNGYGVGTPPPIHTPDPMGSPQRASARFAPGQQQGPLGITGAG